MSVIYKKERMNLSTLSHDQMFFSVTETARFGQDIWWLPLAGGWDLSQTRQKPSDSCTDPLYSFFLQKHQYHWFQSELEETITNSLVFLNFWQHLAQTKHPANLHQLRRSPDGAWPRKHWCWRGAEVGNPRYVSAYRIPFVLRSWFIVIVII